AATAAAPVAAPVVAVATAPAAATAWAGSATSSAESSAELSIADVAKRPPVGGLFCFSDAALQHPLPTARLPEGQTLRNPAACRAEPDIARSQHRLAIASHPAVGVADEY